MDSAAAGFSMSETVFPTPESEYEVSDLPDRRQTETLHHRNSHTSVSQLRALSDTRFPTCPMYTGNRVPGSSLSCKRRAALAIRAQAASDPLLQISGQPVPKMIIVEITKNCLERLQITAEDQERLSIIHVAGTKGKGSTCAFVESILRHHGYKTGMVTSPSLVEFRERIKINGVPVDKQVFTDAYWTVYQQLLMTKSAHANRMPTPQGMILCVALYMFLRIEKVDVAIIEVGVGGETDSTNALQRPAVCAVTSLHLDHQETLGNTVAEIAWHKAGIFRKGVPAVTMPQEYSAAMDVLMQRAKEVQCPLFLAPPLNLEEQEGGVSLGIPGLKQHYNAGLAVQVANIWLQAKTGKGIVNLQNRLCEPQLISTLSVPTLTTPRLSAQMLTGLSKAFLPGRAQVIKKPGITYYLDGAHTLGSMELCAKWFRENADKERAAIKGKVVRALVFSMGRPRKAKPHLEYLKDLGFDIAAFTPRIVSSTSRKQIVEELTFNFKAVDGWDTVCEQVEDWKNILYAAQQPHADPNTPLDAKIISENGYTNEAEYNSQNGAVTGKEEVGGEFCSKTSIQDEVNPFHAQRVNRRVIPFRNHASIDALDMERVNKTNIQNGVENSSMVNGEQNNTANKERIVTTSCKTAAFPSTASALWWATLQKETSLEQMAKADMDAHLSQLGRGVVERSSADGSQVEKAAGVRRLEKSADRSQGGKSADSAQNKTPLESVAKADSQEDGPRAVHVPGLDDLRDDASHVQVLLTGSIVMVGGALAVLQPIVWERDSDQ